MVLVNNMDISFLRNSLIAHRGLHNKEIPENSMKAFKKAIDNNYTIELDVHLLKDGNVVVFHDDNLRRLTGINKKINDTTYIEIKQLKILNTNECIPLLSDVLNMVDGRVPLLIELKTDTKVGLLEDKLLSILKNYKGKYAFQSFNPLSLIYLKKKCNNIPRGILVSDYSKNKINLLKKYILKKMLLNFIVKPDFLSVNYNYLNNRRIQKYKNKKLILTWTIRNINDFDKYKPFCDNYIVENID